MKFSCEEDKKIYENVRRYSQEHVFKWWDELGPESKEKLKRQVREIDFEQFSRLKSILSDRTKKTTLQMEPAEIIPLPEDEGGKKRRNQAERIGIKAIEDGKLGVFMVAGGQGTRPP